METEAPTLHLFVRQKDAAQAESYLAATSEVHNAHCVHLTRPGFSRGAWIHLDRLCDVGIPFFGHWLPQGVAPGCLVFYSGNPLVTWRYWVIDGEGRTQVPVWDEPADLHEERDIRRILARVQSAAKACLAFHRERMVVEQAIVYGRPLPGEEGA